MMSDKKMKPCPFCRVHLHWLNQAWRHLQHNKRHCVLHEIAITDEDAWNNRPAENELNQTIDKLKSIIFNAWNLPAAQEQLRDMEKS